MVVKGPTVSSTLSLEEERVLVKAAQENPSRFAHLYELNFERVYVYIVRRVRERQEAEDLTADVFHRALANLSRFEWRGVPFAAWLLTIASNVLANRWKQAAKHSDISEPRDLQETGSSTSEDLEEIAQRAQLFRMVRKLPESQRRVLQMRFAEEKSIREIAGALGRSEGAVKQLQLRALQNLRSQLTKSGEANG